MISNIQLYGNLQNWRHDYVWYEDRVLIMETIVILGPSVSQTYMPGKVLEFSHKD